MDILVTMFFVHRYLLFCIHLIIVAHFNSHNVFLYNRYQIYRSIFLKEVIVWSHILLVRETRDAWFRCKKINRFPEDILYDITVITYIMVCWCHTWLRSFDNALSYWNTTNMSGYIVLSIAEQHSHLGLLHIRCLRKFEKKNWVLHLMQHEL